MHGGFTCEVVDLGDCFVWCALAGVQAFYVDSASRCLLNVVDVVDQDRGGVLAMVSQDVNDPTGNVVMGVVNDRAHVTGGCTVNRVLW